MIDRVKSKYDLFLQYLHRLNEDESISFVMKIRYICGIVLNYVMFSANIDDYFEFRFYEKSIEEKKNYFTTKDSIRFAEEVDSKELLYLLSSKTEMYRHIRDSVKRDQLFTAEMGYNDFRDFYDKHVEFLYKPDRLDGGRGIEVWNHKYTVDYLWKRAKAKNGILDEMIVQHKKLQELAPGSVNTIRILTLKIKDEIEIIAAALRMGDGISIVDNFCMGGLAATVDIDTGILNNGAYNSLGDKFEVHPYSDVKIKGFQIPNWSRTLKFVKKCAAEFPLNYVAWDVAIRENDSVIIEANPHGMIHVIQLNDTGGRKQQYIKLLKKYKKVNAENEV